MNKPAPKTVLNFLSEHFEFIYELFNLCKQENFLKSEILISLCNQHDIKINILLTYRIIRELKNGDYQFNNFFFEFVSFLLDDFKLDLPESIRKYTTAIEKIYYDLTTETELNRINEYINGLTREIQEFISRIESNTNKLLDETQDLKANIGRIEYSAKIKMASHWIDFYINPLNSVLNKDHSDSIINKLQRISDFANERRLHFSDVNIRLQYEKLYNHILNAEDDLLKHSRILTKELLPLLETIQYEHPILSGLIEFIKSPDQYTPPDLFKPKKRSPFSAYFNEDALFILELTEKKEPITIYEDTEFERPWLFDKEKYKKLLLDSLPIDNYFEWCAVELIKEYESIDAEKFYSLAALLFENEFEAEFIDNNKFCIELQDYTVYSPMIRLKHAAIS
ncbi:Uncharacterized protein dnl_05420 [Desulfonema limicola]|uniref:Uncharacterized protein n=1 Tax=Desulfonema limicola TaxID=45656 RepID=A0A975B3Y5_9BACT|nr:hypothetical protein [Desulfonema limicola]QTA78321.1 Uncharacterized protein dnl_05420 [Desulfonema limicola]